MIRTVQIYINICTTKIFIEKVKMTISYQEEIKFISNKIRELRKEKQMTVQELAYRCDMERSNMSRIESGRTNPHGKDHVYHMQCTERQSS